MKKRLLGILLTLCLILSLLPATALAADISGAISASAAWHDGDVITGAVTITGSSNAAKPVIITVTGEVTVNATITVTGYVIFTGGGTLKRGSYKGYLLELKSGATTIDGITVDGNATLAARALVLVENAATLTIEDGTVLKNNHDNGGCGGAVLCRGTLVMNGGEMIDNTTVMDGGGVCLDSDASFTMNGGSICGNTAEVGEGGGGVFVGYNASFTMHGGSICGNTTDGQTGGGGVLVGEQGSFTMHGGSIFDNTASLSGGGVYLHNDGSFAMNGGSIFGNSAGVAGGGVYLHNDGNLSVSGASSVTDNIKDDNGAVTPNNIDASPYIVTFKVTGALTGAIGVSFTTLDTAFAEADGYTLTEADAAHFFCDTAFDYSMGRN